MNKKFIFILIIVLSLTNICSCGLLQKPIDNKTGFSDSLKLAELNIRKEDWTEAKANLLVSQKTWEKVKPLLQVDIDHDYVNSIEQDFIKLGAYIDTKEKGNSLATILLIIDTWDNIGSL